jgi:hypothetical protein
MPAALADSCFLEPGHISVMPNGSAGDTYSFSGSLARTLERTTMFTLVASGAGRTVTATTVVNVMPASIKGFSAVPDVVAPGQPARLEWLTEFASECTIEPSVGRVDGRGFAEVRPLETTTYTLTAFGLVPRTRSVTVHV